MDRFGKLNYSDSDIPDGQYRHRHSTEITRKLLPENVLGILDAAPAAHREILNFHTSWQGPHFPVLRPKTGRKHLSPHPFSKTEVQVPKLAWTCEIFLAHGQDLTFPSCVQGLGEKICPPEHF